MDGEPPVSDFDTLKKALEERQHHLAALDRYYRGEQPIQFIPNELRGQLGDRLTTLIINWPRVIVDSIEERLDIEGFLLGGEDQADAELWDTWQANDLDEQSQLIHLDSLVHGSAFVSVGAFNDGSARIEPETAHQMCVAYFPGTRTLAAALKVWEDADGKHARLYLPDAVEMWEQDKATANGFAVADRVAHTLGVVPVVPFVNRPRVAATVGESELTDVVRLTDAVCKLATDMMVASEFHAMPRRWATGIQIPAGDQGKARTQEEAKRYWDQATSGKTWLAGPGVNFGQFVEADLGNFTNAIGMLTGQIAAIAGLPPHYLGINTQNPASAEAVRSAEASLVHRAQRKQRTLSGSWEQVMRMSAAVERGIAVADLPPEFNRLTTIWRDPGTPTVAQQADAAVKLVQANIITNDQALEDIGYTPVQIARERQRRQEAAATAAVATVRAQVEEAQRLMSEQGLSQPAAFAAVGLLQAAAQISADTA